MSFEVIPRVNPYSLKPGQATFGDHPLNPRMWRATRRLTSGISEQRDFGNWPTHNENGRDPRGSAKDRVVLWASGEDDIRNEPEDFEQIIPLSSGQIEHFIKHGTTDLPSYPDFIEKEKALDERAF